MCDNEKIGAYIASLRKAVGLTQAGLGERLGVTGQAVSGWERGEFLPDTGILQDLALILDTSVVSAACDRGTDDGGDRLYPAYAGAARCGSLSLPHHGGRTG